MSGDGCKVVGYGDRANGSRYVDNGTVCTLGKLRVSHGRIGCSKLNNVLKQIINACSTANRLVVDISTTLRIRIFCKHFREEWIDKR